jgi:hypothetical protein
LRFAVVIVGLVATASCAATVSPPRAVPPVAQTSPTATATTSTSTPTTALALCRDALAGRDVVSGTWATVGDLRSWGYGGPVPTRPLRDVFAAAAPTDPAAWCWTKDAPDSYTAWGVRAHDAPQHAITVVGPTAVTPSGPPRIP